MLRTASIVVAAGALVGTIATSGLAGTPDSAPASSASPRPDPTLSPPATNTAANCAALAGMTVEAGAVEGAEAFAAGEMIVGGTTVGTRAQVNLCRVRLRLHPVPGSDIRVEVWLPENWNQKLMGFGGGGFDGSLNPDSGKFLNPVVGQGFAAVVSDVGHTPAPTPGTWIHGQPQRVVDFGYRGTHLAAVVAKQVAATYYGAKAKIAYFQGCSNGGRDGLSLASRYPKDYDAIVAGAPANRYVEVVTQLLWYSQSAAVAPNLTAKLSLVHAAILKKCDALDGVKDGILENPLRCQFDPAVLQCKAGQSAGCLTDVEVGALRKIYAGPRLANGQLVMWPPEPGSEGNPGNWAAWITGPVPGLAGQEFYKWMVHDDPNWTVASYSLDRDYPLARSRVAPIIDADNPDLSAFIRRGGKLIIYQGWDDPAITPGSTIQYYEDVLRKVGPAAAKQVRLFMVPGMAHCGGGPGATSFDMQGAMEKWVEQGQAPERILASKPDVPPGAPPLTHPLCAWPSTARYKGKGSIRDAANFVCTAPSNR